MLKIFPRRRDRGPVPGSPDYAQSPSELCSTSQGEPMISTLETGIPQDTITEESRKKKRKEEKKKGKPKLKARIAKFFNRGKDPTSTGPESIPFLELNVYQPASVEELKAHLEQGRLEAAGALLSLERDLREAAAKGSESEEELVQRQNKVEALYTLLRDQVLGVLRRPLEAAPERLRQALAVVAEQEREDERTAAQPGSSALAPTRPRRWMQLWRLGVAQAAEERLGTRPPESAEGRSKVQRAFLHMGHTMRKDLEAVVERLKPLFPAEFHVVAAYAESYHQYFAAQMAATAQLKLDKRDTHNLLLWVQKLYHNDVINSPKLAHELQEVELGSLLPATEIQQLEATFLSKRVATAKKHMVRALKMESRLWDDDKPPQKLDGHCHSELPVHIMQIISQNQMVAEDITADLGIQIQEKLLMELAAFLSSYQNAFVKFLDSGSKKRHYRDNVIANINNCLSFRTSMEQKWQTLKDTHSDMLGTLDKLKSDGFDALLQNLFSDLKPLFKKFTETQWKAPGEILIEILDTVTDSLPAFTQLQDCLHEEFMGEVHLCLVKEYIVRLFKGLLLFKTAEQQQVLEGHILDNATLIRDFCREKGSKAAWLDSALPQLAAMIGLQDPNAMKIEVATCANMFASFSKDHLSAILAIKRNLSSEEAQNIQIIFDDSTTGPRATDHSLFSPIEKPLRLEQD